MQLNWNDALKVGHPVIDEQHRQLFAAFADFIAACEQRRGSAHLTKLFAFLDDYSRRHFAEEEALMERVHFPGREAHCEKHRRFLAKLDALKGELAASGPTVKVLILTTKTLVYWLSEHIHDVDTRLAAFLDEKRRPADPT